MYRQYFGLTGLPFKTTPDPSVFYKNGSRQDILDALIYTVGRGDGIVKVVGEVGCGKTMLLRLLSQSLPSNFSIVYINAPNLSAKDMLLYICNELNFAVDSALHKFELLNRLKQVLVELHGQGRQVVMLIDEAQSMSLDTLEEIRLLSNLETSDDKLLQIVLFGQPELDVAINQDEIRQLKSRISYNIYIPPLSAHEVQAYLNYRMRKSSYEGLDLFDATISKKIHKLTAGFPRSINVIADKLLMAVYGSGANLVTTAHLKQVLATERASSIRTAQMEKTRLTAYALAVIGLFSVITYLLYLLNSQQNIQSSVEISQLLHSQNSNTDTQSGIVTLDKAQEKPSLRVLPDPLLNSNHRLAGDYAITNTDALVGDYEKLRRLLEFHSDARQWLSALPEDSLVIQLSTRNLTSINDVLASYQRNEIPIDSLHLLIDFTQKSKKFRLKTFYMASQHNTDLSELITKLPGNVRSSNPFVTNVNFLTAKLLTTDNEFKRHGIINVKK